MSACCLWCMEHTNHRETSPQASLPVDFHRSCLCKSGTRGTDIFLDSYVGLLHREYLGRYNWVYPNSALSRQYRYRLNFGLFLNIHGIERITRRKIPEVPRGTEAHRAVRPVAPRRDYGFEITCYIVIIQHLPM
jgi:hypothetical protein